MIDDAPYHGQVHGPAPLHRALPRRRNRLFIASLHAAAEAGDEALGAHILQCMARQMSHLERYEDALALVDLAQYGARRRLSPAICSMLASLEARFQAILGNLADSERAADRAEDAFTGIVPGTNRST